MKEKIQKKITTSAQELRNLSHNIHDNPELGFEEHKAVQWQTELLMKHGFHVETPYAGLETAYKAILRFGEGGPTIAFLAEYDALKGLGHGCGHNLIAAMSVGAAIGVSAVLPDLGGEIAVIGCPAEEGGSGKIIMLNNGGFDGIDYAMMIHPANRNIIGRGGLACTNVTIKFFGNAAHSKEPWEGVNALSAVISTFNNIDTLHQKWMPDARINGIITAGGTASNVIPEYAAATFTVRSNTVSYLSLMVKDIERAVQAAAIITGARSEFKVGLISTERYCNAVMGETLKQNMASLGIEMHKPPVGLAIGSSDFGNVSMKIPAIHEYLAIADTTVKNHSKEFCEAAVAKRSDEVLLKGAQGLAMTAYDMLQDEKLRNKIDQEFLKTVPHND